MTVKPLALAVLLFCAASAPAAPSPLNCPCPDTAGVDGCGAMLALGGGSVMFPAFFTGTTTASGSYGIARQSGQTYAVRPNWNVAGVDFAVGPLASKAAAFKDPSVNPPQWCAYSPGLLTCLGPYPASAPLLIDGYDFSANANHPCIRVVAYGNRFTTETLTNNRWIAADDGATDTCAAAGIFFQSANVSPVVITFSNNEIDGKADSGSPRQYGGVTLCTSGQVTMQFNAFLHLNNRPVSISRPATLTATTYPASTYFANYVEGFVYTALPGYEHGEFVEETLSNPNASSAFTDLYSYNTMMQPNNTALTTSSSLIYLSSGRPTGQSSGAAVTRTSTADHNVLVVNSLSGGGGSTSALIEESYDFYASLTITNNFIDNTGAAVDIYTGAPLIGGTYSPEVALAPPTWTGNTYLTTGAAVPFRPGNTPRMTFSKYKCALGGRAER